MRKAFAKSAASVPLQACLLATVVVAQCHGIAFGQDTNVESGPRSLTTPPLGMTGWRHDPVTVTTEALGMTGWQPDPVIAITTHALGMTGWERDPLTVATEALGMTGWRRDPLAVTTEALAMTGWRHGPITVTAHALGMTGWADLPEQCGAPFVRDVAGEGCVCPPGLLPAGGGCVAAGTSPPADLTVETAGREACEAGKSCRFDIRVTNVGAGPFQGPLAVRDEVNLSDARLVADGGRWSCVAGACIHPGVTLAPGESETLTVNVPVPAGARRGSRLQHCAELTAPEPGDAPVRFVQLMLTAAGIEAGPADNQMGRMTRAGIEAFRRTAGLPGGADIDGRLIAALRGLVPVDPHPENDRSCSEARVTG